jgi:muramidase (phage lysozyme)
LQLNKGIFKRNPTGSTTLPGEPHMKRHSAVVLLFFSTLSCSQLLPKAKDLIFSDRDRDLNDSRIRAFLDTIAYAEGTLNKRGYRTQYTYVYFKSFKEHPNKILCALYKGELLCSSAAGRYQFLAKTWKRVAPKINAHDFSPLNQDRAAIELIRENNALEDVKRERFEEAIEKVNKVWASLPGAPYGQPTRTLQELKTVYSQRLKEHQAWWRNIWKKW